MFEQTFVQSHAQARRPWTVAVSLSLQCLVVSVLLLLPLLHPESLRVPDPPPPHVFRAWITQPPLPPAAARATAVSAPAVPRAIFVLPNAPVSPGKRIDIQLADAEPTGWTGPSATTSGPGIADTGTLPPRAVERPVAVTPPVRATIAGPLNVSGGVQDAKLVFGPRPVYPVLAKAAHSQGVVRLEATIAADGLIRNLRVLAGPPLLVNAALDAVRQWRYQPTLLSGVAVEVLTEIDINFTLTK